MSGMVVRNPLIRLMEAHCAFSCFWICGSLKVILLDLG